MKLLFHTRNINELGTKPIRSSAERRAQRRREGAMKRRVMFAVLMLLAVAGAGCAAPTAAGQPAIPGRRVQGAQVIAQGPVPYQVGAYELVFAEQPDTSTQTRRAALLVDLVGG